MIDLSLKFSTGTSLCTNEGGAVGIISASRKDWSPSVDSSAKVEEEMRPNFDVRIKGRSDDKCSGFLPAVSIKQIGYGDIWKHREEDESETWELTQLASIWLRRIVNCQSGK